MPDTATPSISTPGPAAGPLPLPVVERAASAGTGGPVSLPRRVFRVARFAPLVMALMATGGLVGMYFQPPGLRFMMRTLGLQPGGGATNPIAVPAPHAAGPAVPAANPPTVAGLGRLLPEGDVVTVAPPFGAADARIAELRVQEGERVARGEILAVLDNERQLLATVDSARSTVAAREAVLAQVRAATVASRAEAEAALARAETTARNAARDFERVEELRRSGFAADQTFEQRRTARDETAREVERLRATLSRFGQAEPDNQPDVRVALSNVDQARADLARATADIEKAYVRAPVDSTVLAIVARPGEKPGPSGILKLGDIDRMKAEVEIYQSMIGRVSAGAAVELHAEALPEPLRGTVARIGLEVGRQTLLDAGPAANTDARVVRVTVALDRPSADLARRFTNLQVTARIAASAP